MPPRRHLSDKQHREQALFLAFRHRLPEISDLAWSQAERPDFRLTRGETTIGVEVTEALVSTRIKARESLTTLIVQTARAAYHREPRHPLLVWVTFTAQLRLSKPDAVQLGKRLALAVADHAAVGAAGRVRRTCLPAGVSRASFAPLRSGSQPVWAPVEAGWLPDLDPETLRLTIARKEPLVTAYRAACDEAWLLVALGGSRPSAWFSLADEELAGPFATAFDRVYVLDLQQERVDRMVLSRLPTMPPSGPTGRSDATREQR